MSTFGTVIADVKTACRETTTEKDAYLLAAAGRIWTTLLQSDDWPQSRTTGQVVSVVSGTQAYDLPADFDRYAGDRVNYSPLSGIAFNAYSLPILYRNSTRGDTRISLWESIVSTTPALYTMPQAVGIQAGGANTFQMILYPLAGSTGDTITFDYYSIPQRSEITTGATVVPDDLYETLFAALSADYYRFTGNLEQMQIMTQQAAQAHRSARMTLARL